MTALEYLQSLRPIYLPVSREGSIPCAPPSNSELKRWLRKGSVIINGTTPSPLDEVQEPIHELIFFPKGRRVTMVETC